MKYFNKIYIGFFVKTKLNFRWQIGIDDLDILERQKTIIVYMTKRIDVWRFGQTDII